MGDNFRGSTSDERLRSWDSKSHAMTTIDLGHRLNHDGFTYSGTYKGTGLVNGGVMYVLMQVPAGSEPHLARTSISVGNGDVDIHAFENTTFSAAGTVIPAINTNRALAADNTAAMIVTHSPTITAPGDELHVGWIPPTPVGQGQTASGAADVQAGEEWILKGGVDYAWSVTNNSGETIDVSLDVVWFEINYTEA